MNMEQESLHKIRDLGLAASLVSLDFEILDTERDTQGRAYFVFKQTTKLEQAVNDYWSNTLSVKARQYFDNTKMLKTRIYSE